MSIFHRSVSHCIFVVLFLMPMTAFTHPVISEVMWAGSDISTADEWLEIANPTESEVDLSGWSVTSMNSKGEHVVAALFQTGSTIGAGEYLVIAGRTAASSRLLTEPFVMSSSLSLPNTKLLVRLLDTSGATVDEIDDGSGAPFAGANPSGTGAKASMERLDLLAPGNVKENWGTAVVSMGFDPGSLIFGTPGFTRGIPSEDPLPCIDPLEIAIAVQSGPLVATGKATINFQAVATVGSLSGVACHWSFGDGFQSESCNPPVHSFTTAGTYFVRVEAKNQCDNTLVQEQVVEVLSDQSMTAPAPASSEWYDGSRLVLRGALPNPEGTDTAKEWIEIKNLESKHTDLKGWKITVGESSIRSYSLQGLVPSDDRLRIYDSETKFSLPNTASRIQLLTPSGLVVSTIRWSKTTEDQVMRTDDLRDIDVKGTVIAVTGPVTFELALEGEARRVLGDDTVSVRLLGLSEVKTHKNNEDIEFLRALIEGKRVELEFDTDTWDTDGNLLAYVIEGNVLLQQNMILSRFWTVDHDSEYRRRKEFEDLEKTLKPIQSTIKTQGALLYEEKSMYGDSGSVLIITEIYPSPYPGSGMAGKEEWEGEEWLEVKNPNQYVVDLIDWHLLIDGKKKELPEGLRVLSGSTVIIGMKLKNAGATLELQDPAGSIVSTVSYPELKNGLSYARDAEGNFCITTKATPGRVNQCQAAALNAKPSARKAAPKTAVSSRVKAYAASYTAQVEDEADSESPIVIFQGDTESYGREAMVIAFISGLAGSLILLFGAWKMWTILQNRRPKCA